ncbi:Intermediate filament protein [Quaeritorhiza haematococci]|nr:Intermediate filament protein [Quaeritorhiza haematococci]
MATQRGGVWRVGDALSKLAAVRYPTIPTDDDQQPPCRSSERVFTFKDVIIAIRKLVLFSSKCLSISISWVEKNSTLTLSILASFLFARTLIYYILYYVFILVSLLAIFAFVVAAQPHLVYPKRNLLASAHDARSTIIKRITSLPLSDPQRWRKRQKIRSKERSTVPSLPFVQSREIQQRLDDLLFYVSRDFIWTWFPRISSEPVFIHRVDYAIRFAVESLKKRCEKVDFNKFVVNRVVPILIGHVTEFRNAEKGVRGQRFQRSITESDELSYKIASYYRKGRLHPAISATSTSSLPLELAYLRQLFAPVLRKILPSNEAKSQVLIVLVREIIVSRIIQPVVESLADEDFWNQQINWMDGLCGFPALFSSRICAVNLLKKIREALDREKDPTDNESQTDLLTQQSKMRTFEEFISLIKRCNNLSDAHSMRNSIATEMAKKTAEIAHCNNGDIINGVKVSDTRVYINQLRVAMKRIEKRIDQLNGRREKDRRPKFLSKKSSFEKPSMHRILEDPQCLTFFTEFIDTEQRPKQYQFWLTVESLHLQMETILTNSVKLGEMVQGSALSAATATTQPADSSSSIKEKASSSAADGPETEGKEGLKVDEKGKKSKESSANDVVAADVWQNIYADILRIYNMYFAPDAPMHADASSVSSETRGRIDAFVLALRNLMMSPTTTTTTPAVASAAASTASTTAAAATRSDSEPVFDAKTTAQKFFEILTDPEIGFPATILQAQEEVFEAMERYDYPQFLRNPLYIKYVTQRNWFGSTSTSASSSPKRSQGRSSGGRSSIISSINVVGPIGLRGERRASFHRKTSTESFTSQISKRSSVGVKTSKKSKSVGEDDEAAPSVLFDDDDLQDESFSGNLPSEDAVVVGGKGPFGKRPAGGGIGARTVGKRKSVIGMFRKRPSRKSFEDLGGIAIAAGGSGSSRSMLDITGEESGEGNISRATSASTDFDQLSEQLVQQQQQQNTEAALFIPISRESSVANELAAIISSEENAYYTSRRSGTQQHRQSSDLELELPQQTRKKKKNASTTSSMTSSSVAAGSSRKRDSDDGSSSSSSPTKNFGQKFNLINHAKRGLSEWKSRESLSNLLDAGGRDEAKLTTRPRRPSGGTLDRNSGGETSTNFVAELFSKGRKTINMGRSPSPEKEKEKDKEGKTLGGLVVGAFRGLKSGAGTSSTPPSDDDLFVEDSMVQPPLSDNMVGLNLANAGGLILQPVSMDPSSSSSSSSLLLTTFKRRVAGVADGDGGNAPKFREQHNHHHQQRRKVSVGFGSKKAKMRQSKRGLFEKKGGQKGDSRLKPGTSSSNSHTEDTSETTSVIATVSSTPSLSVKASELSMSDSGMAVSASSIVVRVSGTVGAAEQQRLEGNADILPKQQSAESDVSEESEESETFEASDVLAEEDDKESVDSGGSGKEVDTFRGIGRQKKPNRGFAFRKPATISRVVLPPQQRTVSRTSTVFFDAEGPRFDREEDDEEAEEDEDGEVGVAGAGVDDGNDSDEDEESGDSGIEHFRLDDRSQDGDLASSSPTSPLANAPWDTDGDEGEMTEWKKSTDLSEAGGEVADTTSSASSADGSPGSRLRTFLRVPGELASSSASTVSSVQLIVREDNKQEEMVRSTSSGVSSESMTPNMSPTDAESVALMKPSSTLEGQLGEGYRVAGSATSTRSKALKTEPELTYAVVEGDVPGASVESTVPLIKIDLHPQQALSSSNTAGSAHTITSLSSQPSSSSLTHVAPPPPLPPRPSSTTLTFPLLSSSNLKSAFPGTADAEDETTIDDEDLLPAAIPPTRAILEVKDHIANLTKEQSEIEREIKSISTATAGAHTSLSPSPSLTSTSSSPKGAAGGESAESKSTASGPSKNPLSTSTDRNEAEKASQVHLSVTPSTPPHNSTSTTASSSPQPPVSVSTTSSGQLAAPSLTTQQQNKDRLRQLQLMKLGLGVELVKAVELKRRLEIFELQNLIEPEFAKVSINGYDIVQDPNGKDFVVYFIYVQRQTREQPSARRRNSAAATTASLVADASASIGGTVTDSSSASSKSSRRTSAIKSAAGPLPDDMNLNNVANDDDGSLDSGWLVSRRYSDFFQLHQDLKSEYPGIVGMYELPGKAFNHLLKVKKDFLENRKAALEKYLQNLIRHREICQSLEFVRFISPEVISTAVMRLHTFSRQRGFQSQQSYNSISSISTSSITLMKGRKSAHMDGGGDILVTMTDQQNIPTKRSFMKLLHNVDDTLFSKLRNSTSSSSQQQQQQFPTAGNTIISSLFPVESRATASSATTTSSDTVHGGGLERTSSLSRRKSESRKGDSAKRGDKRRSSLGGAGGTPVMGTKSNKKDSQYSGATASASSPPEQPVGSNSNNTGDLSDIFASGERPSNDDVDISVTDMIVDLFIEVFELKERNNWLRRGAVVLLFQQIFGGTIDRRVKENIAFLLGEDNVVYALDKLKDSFWPNGARFGTAVDEAGALGEEGDSEDGEKEQDEEGTGGGGGSVRKTNDGVSAEKQDRSGGRTKMGGGMEGRDEKIGEGSTSGAASRWDSGDKLSPGKVDGVGGSPSATKSNPNTNSSTGTSPSNNASGSSSGCNGGVRTAEQRKRTKAEAESKLSNLIPELLGGVVGRQNAKRGAARLFNVFQNKRLNQQLLYMLLDEIVVALFPEVKDVVSYQAI